LHESVAVVWGTVARIGANPSDPVEEVVECLIVFCLGGIGAPVDGAGVGGIQTSGGNVAAVLFVVSHFDQGGNVGVGGHRIGVGWFGRIVARMGGQSPIASFRALNAANQWAASES